MSCQANLAGYPAIFFDLTPKLNRSPCLKSGLNHRPEEGRLYSFRQNKNSPYFLRLFRDIIGEVKLFHDHDLLEQYILASYKWEWGCVVKTRQMHAHIRSGSKIEAAVEELILKEAEKPSKGIIRSRQAAQNYTIKGHTTYY
ncbi:hypothetical protein JFN88_03550 [Paenibacillus sp. MAHUQ-46]|uniref:Uncharacterized protein n=2 Tax=Paenibacillus TaxID=44249 RepID=A0A934J4W2_9BACL|nr:hypothetical protein [Paenibacillus roseus]MBJ6360397.1 hypothetical protein [Paenibacillus roseus]